MNWVLVLFAVVLLAMAATVGMTFVSAIREFVAAFLAPHVPSPETLGYDIRQLEHVEGQGRHRTVWHEYQVALTPPLSELSLVDGELRSTLIPKLGLRPRITTADTPKTADKVFNGLFDFTCSPSPEASLALDNIHVRRHLMDLSESFDGIWIDDGTLRLLQRSATDVATSESMTAIDIEAIASVLYQLDQVLADDTELDFTDASHDDATAAAAAAVKAGPRG